MTEQSRIVAKIIRDARLMLRPVGRRSGMSYQAVLGSLLEAAQQLDEADAELRQAQILASWSPPRLSLTSRKDL